MLEASTLAPPRLSPPLRCGEPLNPETFARIRREMILHGCKWDPQVGDVSTLAAFPLLIPSSRWRELAILAEQLSAELLASEQELIRRPDLYGRLGMPRRLRRMLERAAPRQSEVPAGPRTMRFDFHWTAAGWRISEVNSDVPGGFTESSGLPALMAPHYPATRPVGDPGDAWADAIVRACGEMRHAALLAATGYMEDQQIIAYLRGFLARRGVTGHMIGPGHIRWIGDRPTLQTDWYRGPVGIIVRFYQAEWLAVARGVSDLHRFAAGSATPITNPMWAALTESKRYPLLWKELTTHLPTWNRLLMETRDPRDVLWSRDERWILKAAFCNTGDEIGIRELLTSRQWRRLSLCVRLFASQWVAQRRFFVEPIESVDGPVYPCVGVYTIDGRVAGAYGRIARKPLIDFEAVDAAVLVEDADEE
jgi:hypothetical protein